MEKKIINFDEQAAIVSHYLQNIYSSYSYPFEAEALKALNVGSPEQIISNLQDGGYQTELFEELTKKIPFPSPVHPKFTFIDLFAGIGGFRVAMQNLGGKCVFSSEWDENAKQTYFANFGEVPFGDITKERTKSFIPKDFDILCAGFPCQAFSIAGHQRGFQDTRGTLFFDVAKVLKERHPSAFFLENVKNLKSHDSGNTFRILKQTLEDLGYGVHAEVLNSMDYANVPQNRERIFIVGFDKKTVKNWEDFVFPEKIQLQRTIHDCINQFEADENLFYTEKFPHYKELVEGMINKDTVYQWRRQYVRENQSNVCPTLTANMGEGGHNVPLIITDKGFRKLSPKECLNFQGFPAEYEFPNIANSKKYKQAGNSVTVPLIQRVASNLLKVLL